MKLCTIEGCERKHYGRGWCALHWKRNHVHGNPLAEVRRYVTGPEQCTTSGCSNPKSKKASKGRCSTCFWREYRAGRKDDLDANYKEWREAKGSRWASMQEPERETYRVNSAKRRAARKGDTPFEVTIRDVERLRVRQSGACAYCGSINTLQLDHVMPLAAGGRHAVGNLVLACEPCNKSKGSATVTEWKLAIKLGRPIPKRLYREVASA